MAQVDEPLCPLCDRPLVPGPSVNEHHLVPRSFKGTETVTLHRVCHGKVHAVLSERELSSWFHTVERLRAHPEIESFRRWLRGKPPEFVSRHRGGRRAR
jgi:hypothetical protein